MTESAASTELLVVFESAEVLAISAIQHYGYCPRQFALIHVEQAWAENRFTAEGQILHERVDSGHSEIRHGVRTERSVLLKSERLGLTGKLDLLEIEAGETTDQGHTLKPVEYKRGKPKVQNWDRMQVCAQALCLEEMRGVSIKAGAIWYWETRERVPVIIDEELRKQTLAAIRGAQDLIKQGKTPKPAVPPARCRACSLVDLCNPKAFKNDHSSQYIKEMFE